MLWSSDLMRVELYHIPGNCMVIVYVVIDQHSAHIDALID